MNYDARADALLSFLSLDQPVHPDSSIPSHKKVPNSSEQRTTIDKICDNEQEHYSHSANRKKRSAAQAILQKSHLL
jgi:hypothetical protein